MNKLERKFWKWAEKSFTWPNFLGAIYRKRKKHKLDKLEDKEGK